MAGTGKSSIALTVAASLNDGKPFANKSQLAHGTFLGASFFFKRGDALRNRTGNIFTTIARSLVETVPELERHIVSAIRGNMNIGTKAPQQQFDHLIVGPLLALGEELFTPMRLIVVIDALDECESQPEAEELIAILGRLNSLHHVQLRVLITSRQENHILRAVEGLPSGICYLMALEKIPQKREADEHIDDITSYLQHEMLRISRQRSFPSDWLKEGMLDRLVKKTDGLFIYAATACRFLDTDFFDDESRDGRLDAIFGDETEAGAPQHTVDGIYRKVLMFLVAGRLEKEKQRIFTLLREILGCIVMLYEPTSLPTLRQYLPHITSRQLDTVLSQLHSVLNVPKDKDAPIGLVHLSFADFLLSQERCSDKFWVDKSLVHCHLLNRCITIMDQELHQDMCDLEQPGFLAHDVPESKIEEFLPRHLQYSCRYWKDHLIQLSGSQSQNDLLQDDGKVHRFLLRNLLFWLETLSLMKEIGTAVLSILDIVNLVDVKKTPDLFALVEDAERFIVSSRWIIGHAPLQAYCSALIFSPMKSIVREQFLTSAPSWITRWPTVKDQWGTERVSIHGLSNPYTLVSFCPTGNLIATTSGDRISLWDAVTGTERFRFDDAWNGRIFPNLVFSPDGNMIAYVVKIKLGLVPCDYGIRVRELATGKVVDLDTGNWAPIDTELGPFIAISPGNTNLLASYTFHGLDFYLQLWNARTGHVIQKTKLDVGPSVGEGGPAIRESEPSFLSWLIQERMPFPGPLSFSPDGKTLAIMCNFKSLLIWDVEKGFVQKNIILSHEGYPESSWRPALTFSASGKTLALAIATNHVNFTNQQPPMTHLYTVSLPSLEDHSALETIDKLSALALSPLDDNMIAYGTTRNTVVVYNTATKQVVSETQTHEAVSGLVFSQDASRLWVVLQNNPSVKLEVWEMVSIRKRQVNPHFFPHPDPITRTKFLAQVDWPGSSTVRIGDSPLGAIIQRWDTQSGVLTTQEVLEEQLKFRFRKWEISPNGAIICAVNRDKTICLFNIQTMTTILRYDDSIYTEEIVFSPDSKLVAIASSSKVHVLDTTTLRKAEFENWPWMYYNRPKFSLSGGLFRLLENDSGKVSLVEIQTSNIIATVDTTGTNHGVSSSLNSRLCFHPKGHMVSAYICGALFVWETSTGKERFRFNNHGKKIRNCYGIAMSQDRIAMTWAPDYRTSCVTVWDYTTGEEIWCFFLEDTAYFRPDRIFWSEDNEHLECEWGRLPYPFTASTNVNAPNTRPNDAKYCLRVEGEWIIQGYERIIWLPQAYMVTSVALKDRTLTLGHEFGEVSFWEFDLAASPRFKRRKRAHT
ncbi:hypothetical protein B0T17DRAFT_583187 [Bombardia bombarda]|uniref:Nephrocystin 3-like N-terminal domain-containing protein n=1 Tax=Bombardia bombarda TaxID=252184 RepID=A0AA40BVM2_9PEZI|nr:hypothetical protein B0T17DRAFT_583187 [Bombardia bombarda]